MVGRPCPGVEESSHRIVEGMEDRIGPDPAVGLRQADIGGDRRRLADFRGEMRDVGPAIAVAYEARIALHEERRVEHVRERRRDLARTDVPGDMACPGLLGQPHRAEPTRDAAAGMLADQHDVRGAVLVSGLQRMGFVGSEER